VFDSRSHEQQVAWPERIALAIVKEHTAAANDEINLVLWVRCLLARAGREREGDIQRAALENANSVLAPGTGYAGLSLGETNHAATMCVRHAEPLLHSNGDIARSFSAC